MKRAGAASNSSNHDNLLLLSQEYTGKRRRLQTGSHSTNELEALALADSICGHLDFAVLTHLGERLTEPAFDAVAINGQRRLMRAMANFLSDLAKLPAPKKVPIRALYRLWQVCAHTLTSLTLVNRSEKAEQVGRDHLRALMYLNNYMRTRLESFARQNRFSLPVDAFITCILVHPKYKASLFGALWEFPDFAKDDKSGDHNRKFLQWLHNAKELQFSECGLAESAIQTILEANHALYGSNGSAIAGSYSELGLACNPGKLNFLPIEFWDSCLSLTRTQEEITCEYSWMVSLAETLVSNAATALLRDYHLRVSSLICRKWNFDGERKWWGELVRVAYVQLHVTHVRRFLTPPLTEKDLALANVLAAKLAQLSIPSGAMQLDYSYKTGTIELLTSEIFLAALYVRQQNDPPLFCSAMELLTVLFSQPSARLRLLNQYGFSAWWRKVTSGLLSHFDTIFDLNVFRRFVGVLKQLSGYQRDFAQLFLNSTSLESVQPDFSLSKVIDQGRQTNHTASMGVLYIQLGLKLEERLVAHCDGSISPLKKALLQPVEELYSCVEEYWEGLALLFSAPCSVAPLASRPDLIFLPNLCKRLEQMKNATEIAKSIVVGTLGLSQSLPSKALYELLSGLADFVYFTVWGSLAKACSFKVEFYANSTSQSAKFRPSLGLLDAAAALNAVDIQNLAIRCTGAMFEKEKGAGSGQVKSCLSVLLLDMMSRHSLLKPTSGVSGPCAALSICWKEQSLRLENPDLGQRSVVRATELYFLSLLHQMATAHFKRSCGELISLEELMLTLLLDGRVLPPSAEDLKLRSLLFVKDLRGWYATQRLAPKSSDNASVLLAFEDGETLRFERPTLVSLGRYFEKVINGPFSESAEKVITLSNVDSESFLLYALVNAPQTLKLGVEVASVQRSTAEALGSLLKVMDLDDEFLAQSCGGENLKLKVLLDLLLSSEGRDRYESVWQMLDWIYWKRSLSPVVKDPSQWLKPKLSSQNAPSKVTRNGPFDQFILVIKTAVWWLLILDLNYWYYNKDFQNLLEVEGIPLGEFVIAIVNSFQNII